MAHLIEALNSEHPSDESFKLEENMEANSERLTTTLQAEGGPGPHARPTPHDLFHTRPKTFTDKIALFFFRRGWIGVPKYLEDLNSRIPREVFVNYDLPLRVVTSSGTQVISYPPNKIRTAKYTPLSFIPKNLVLQFSRVANIYFLFIVLITLESYVEF